MQDNKTDVTAETLAPEVAEPVTEESELEINSDTDEKAEAAKPQKADKQTKRLKKTEVALLEAAERIANLETALAEQKDRQLRIQAEFDNYRKRNATVRTDALTEGTVEVIKAMLPIMDNFERAITAAENASDMSDDNGFVVGVKQVYSQLSESLARLGLEEIPADGKFDPALHEAVLRDESGEAEEGTITAILRKGYKVKDRIIRHTLVKVAV